MSLDPSWFVPSQFAYQKPELGDLIEIYGFPGALTSCLQVRGYIACANPIIIDSNATSGMSGGLIVHTSKQDGRRRLLGLYLGRYSDNIASPMPFARYVPFAEVLSTFNTEHIQNFPDEFTTGTSPDSN